MAPLGWNEKWNPFKDVEKMLHFRYHDKERERSQHASFLAKRTQGTRRRCPLRHSRFAWSGPPHDPIRCYICLDCNAAASEPEIKDRGYDFETVPIEILDEIWDLDLQRQAETNPKQFWIPGMP